jgi:hypothetical protein
MAPLWAVWLLAMVFGLALFAWVTRPRERMTYRIRCPAHGIEATIVVRGPSGDEPRHVERCSLRLPPARIDCGERCLRPAARAEPAPPSTDQREAMSA